MSAFDEFRKAVAQWDAENEKKDAIRRMNERSLQYLQGKYMWDAQQSQLQNAFGLQGIGAGLIPAPYMPQHEHPTPKPAIDPAKLAALRAAEPQMITQRMPDSIIPIVAWRAWDVETLNNEWVLTAIAQEAIWEPKKKLEARCSSHDNEHPVPYRNCQCGIWSFTTLEKLLPALQGYSNVRVFGQVTIWGRIIECEHGFRSQYAYPKELWLLDPSMEQLGYTYGVPVRTAK